MKIYLLNSDLNLKTIIEEYLLDTTWSVKTLQDIPLEDHLDGVFFIEFSPLSQLNWSHLPVLTQTHTLKNWVVCSLLPPNFSQSHLLVKYGISYLMYPFDKENFFQKVKQCQSIR